ncbi:hypothetical protein OROMI_000380 [Orobanche minor]
MYRSGTKWAFYFFLLQKGSFVKGIVLCSSFLCNQFAGHIFPALISQADPMASEVESVVDAASEGGALLADDPHAHYRVDAYHYLVIKENGEYSLSHKPEEIPKGVVVEADPADTCKKGVRHFRVRKYGMNTFDLVTVGTITIQNGFAYIAGQYIDEEEPDPSNEFAYIPPFAIAYSIQPPDDLNKFAKEMEYKVHKHLKEQVAKYCLHTPASILNIDLKRRYSLEQQNLCRRCGNIKYRGGYDLCDGCVCSSLINHEGRGGDEVETHNVSMDTDVKEGVVGLKT